MQVNIPTRNALKVAADKWTKFFPSKFLGAIMDASLVRKTYPICYFSASMQLASVGKNMKNDQVCCN